jgi:hypothetical protein
MALQFSKLARELAINIQAMNALPHVKPGMQPLRYERAEIDAYERVIELMTALTRVNVETCSDALTAVGLAYAEAAGALDSEISDREAKVSLLKIGRLLYSVADFLREADARQDEALAGYLLQKDLDPRRL